MVYSLNQFFIEDTLIPIYGYGLYKMSTNASNEYFYIDYRDSRIPYLNIPSNNWVDHWIKYDFSNNKFYYSTISSVGPYTQISKGQYLKFWEMQATDPPRPETSQFPDYWENCLVVINNGNEYPKLVWGPHPDDQQTIDVTGYNIYRALTNNNPPPNPNFVLIATVDDQTFQYTDTQYGLGSSILLHYEVKAIYENQTKNKVYETTPTNTVIVGGSLLKHGREREKKLINLLCIRIILIHLIP